MMVGIPRMSKTASCSVKNCMACFQNLRCQGWDIIETTQLQSLLPQTTLQTSRISKLEFLSTETACRHSLLHVRARLPVSPDRSERKA